MTVYVSVSPKVQRIIPTLGSPVDGEALGACRAIGRVLGGAGQTFHDLAQAVAVTGSTTRSGCLGAETDRGASRYGYRPSAKPPSTFTPKQTREHRLLAAWCLRNDGGRLSERDRAFVQSITDRLRELTIRQADWLADIADKLHERMAA